MTDRIELTAETVGAVIELWPDGRMKGKLGGLFAPKGVVTTIEHPDNRTRSYL